MYEYLPYVAINFAVARRSMDEECRDFCDWAKSLPFPHKLLAPWSITKERNQQKDSNAGGNSGKRNFDRVLIRKW